MMIRLLPAVVLLVSCATSSTPPARTWSMPPALLAKYEPYGSPGTGAITGQAFLRTRGGDVKYAAGEMVTAEPAVEEAVGLAKAIGQRPPWPEAEPYRRTTQADAEGRFSFQELPAGQWLLMTQVYWEIPTGAYLGPTTRRTGDVIMKVVEVGDGQQVTVVLTE